MAVIKYKDPTTGQLLPIVGPPGKSAYDSAAEGGYTGTKEEFYKLLATIGNVSNPNLLINWDLTNPINQRGQTEYTSEGYTVDRWRISSGVNLSISPVGIVFKTSEQYRTFSQIAEVDVSKGQHYTLAVNIDTDDDLLYAEAFIGSSQGYLGVLKNGINIFSFVAPASFDRIAVNVTSRTDNAASAKLKGIKLELGDHFTGFHPTDPATELAKCQRYYARSVWMESRTGFSVGNEFRLVQQFYPVQMRIAPTIKVLNPNGIARINTIDLSTNITNPTNDQIKFDSTIGIRNHRMFCPQFVLGSLPIKDYVMGISDGVYEFDAEIY